VASLEPFLAVEPGRADKRRVRKRADDEVVSRIGAEARRRLLDRRRAVLLGRRTEGVALALSIRTFVRL
jgi:hypothetical protein